MSASVLAEIITTESRQVRYNREYRQRAAAQRRRERDEAMQLALIGWLPWSAVPPPLPEPAPPRLLCEPSPGPARACQWIVDDATGCMCGAASVRGRSWCSEHVRRVFAPREDADA